MTADQRLTLILSVISIIGLPTLGLLFRAMMKWSRMEEGLNAVKEDLTQLVTTNQSAHEEIIKNLTKQTDGLDKRVRWIEERLWGPASGR